MRFGFGKNWENFIDKYFSEERLAIAQKHLLSFLGIESLDGKTFLDIGCGSGLHSYAAFRSGAKKIVSFDYDLASVNTTKVLWEYAGSPENWHIMQGSVLDEEFMAEFKGMDIIYSWGVLHHTGEMWKAIKNTCSLACGNSLVYLALYTDEFMPDPGEFWLNIKQKYNSSSWLTKRWLECWYTWNYTWPGSSIIQKAFGIPKQLKHIWGYKKSRGMNFYTDIKDWLGGWPMEFAKTLDVINFGENEFNFELLNLSVGEANSEYLFRQNGGDGISRHTYQLEKIPLEPPYEKINGCCWKIELPQYSNLSDKNATPQKSNLILFDDGELCLFPHSQHQRIQDIGKGSYSHWGDSLYFSSRDNSDPNDNGREYSIAFREFS